MDKHAWLAYLIALMSIVRTTFSFQLTSARFSHAIQSNVRVFRSSARGELGDMAARNTPVDSNLRDNSRFSFGNSVVELGPIETSDLSKYLDNVQHTLIMDGLSSIYPKGNPCRGVFCSRSLNMSDIKVIGYDMDYTLVRYRVNVFESCAYGYAKDVLRRYGFWVEGLSFLSDIACRGLIVDKDHGNIVKVDRFGYVQDAMHGLKKLTPSEFTSLYGREMVDLRDEARWVFINTLFSVSECSLYMQLVERLDDNSLERNSVAPFNFNKCNTYNKLFSVASKAIFRAHVEGNMKKEIQEDPARFIELDLELVPTLVDQSLAGRKLALITNSNWEYTDRIMTYLVHEHFSRTGRQASTKTTTLTSDWRELFDLVIVSARKPDFFTGRNPVYRVLVPEAVQEGDEGSEGQQGLAQGAVMQEDFKMREGHVYNGGSARMVEKLFDCSSDSILYVGDHVFADLTIAKATLRWRTLLVMQELEKEVLELAHCTSKRKRVEDLVDNKMRCLQEINRLRMLAYHEPANRDGEVAIQRLTATLTQIDGEISDLLLTYGSSVNKFWGLMSRAGVYDKSHMMRQIEKYADIYTSRVSNLLHYTPHAFFYSSFQSLAHDKKTDLILFIEENNFEGGHG